jgi:hypothetical protein
MSFQRTISPLVVDYVIGFRERLLRLLQRLYAEGPIIITIKPKTSSFRVRNGLGHGKLMIDFQAPANISYEIIDLCGLSQSASVGSNVVRNF